MKPSEVQDNEYNEYRKLFWDTLSKLHDDSEESWNKLRAVYRPPMKLCRFRSVNQSTLQQLQENKVYFSSANYYDDPFDTYFYMNHAEIRCQLEQLERLMENCTDEQLCDMFAQLYGGDINRKIISLALEDAKKNPVDYQQLEKRISQIKEIIQKQIFSVCFCDNPKNETLWLKYADNHRGFVLVFDMTDSKVFPHKGEQDTSDNEYLYLSNPPNVYPIYYTNDKYDATQYAIGVQALNMIPPCMEKANPHIYQQQKKALRWEIERISLVKKKCHENDHEWRMLCPLVGPLRPVIDMKPTSIALGLRMPEYERRLVISAAKVAGIDSINEMYIDDMDELQMRPVQYETSAYKWE